MPYTFFRHYGVRGPVEQHARELLRVQRVAAGMLEKARLEAGVDRRPSEEGVNERRRLLVRERRDEDRRGVQLAPAPSSSAW